MASLKLLLVAVLATVVVLAEGFPANSPAGPGRRLQKSAVPPPPPGASKDLEGSESAYWGGYGPYGYGGWGYGGWGGYGWGGYGYGWGGYPYWGGYYGGYYPYGYYGWW